MAPPPPTTPQPFMPAQISQPFNDFTIVDEKPIIMEQQSSLVSNIQDSITMEQRQTMANDVQQHSTVASHYNVKDPEIQKAMVQQFSAISGMKMEWSEKCLKDMKWDFEVS